MASEQALLESNQSTNVRELASTVDRGHGTPLGPILVSCRWENIPHPDLDRQFHSRVVDQKTGESLIFWPNAASAFVPRLQSNDLRRSHHSRGVKDYGRR